MKPAPDRIMPGLREHEAGGSLAGLASAMLARHGFDRQGNPLRPSWADRRTQRTAPRARKPAPASPAPAARIAPDRPLDLSAPRPIPPSTIGQDRVTVRNLNVPE